MKDNPALSEPDAVYTLVRASYLLCENCTHTQNLCAVLGYIWFDFLALSRASTGSLLLEVSVAKYHSAWGYYGVKGSVCLKQSARWTVNELWKIPSPPLFPMSELGEVHLTIFCTFSNLTIRGENVSCNHGFNFSLQHCLLIFFSLHLLYIRLERLLESVLLSWFEQLLHLPTLRNSQLFTTSLHVTAKITCLGRRCTN